MGQLKKRIRNYRQAVGLRGLAIAVRAQLGGRTALFEKWVPGLPHPLYLRVPSSDVPTFNQVFTEREYEFATAREPRCIVDVGANIGLAALWFAARYPNARILALEPERSNFELLRKNTAAYPQITAVQAALWDVPGEIDLVDPGEGKWGFMTAASDSKSAASVCHTVRAMTVNELMAEQGLDRIDILKIDIEGAEKEVFRDSSAWIDRVDALIVELHERKKPGCRRSFYNGTAGFDAEWMQGENVYLSREDFIQRTAPQARLKG